TQAGETSPQDLAFIRLAHPLGLVDGTVLVAVGNEFTKDYIENRTREQLCSALGTLLGREARLAVTVDPALEVLSPEPAPLDHADDARPGPDRFDSERAEPDRSEPDRFDAERTAVARPGPGSNLPDSRTAAAQPARLNPKYQFETFVIGSSNRFAHAAAVAVAEAPAKAYNPLFIYGDSGLGKTHLLHAIGHYAFSLYPGVRVRYVNSEEFTNDFINSIGEGKAGAFQRRYREVDVLLVDDIQFLQGKEQTMEEFFHTFNTLHNANKQVVI